MSSDIVPGSSDIVGSPSPRSSPSEPETPPNSYPPSDPNDDIRDWPLPSYYWIENLIRFPLSNRLRGPPGGYQDEFDNHARWEENAYYYLVGDGCRPPYRRGNISGVVGGIFSPPTNLRWNDQLTDDPNIDTNLFPLEYSTLPDDPPNREYPTETVDDVNYIMRQQLTRWLKFRMWQLSIRGYNEAKAYRHAEFLHDHITDTDYHSSLGIKTSLASVKKLAKETKKYAVENSGYKGSKQVFQDLIIWEQFKNNHILETQSPEEWLKMADEVFQKEIETPHHRELVQLSGGADPLEPTEDNNNNHESEFDGFEDEEDETIHPWSFTYFRANLEELLTRHINSPQYGNETRSLLDVLNRPELTFNHDPWQQNFFTTWVEYTYYECLKQQHLDDRLTDGEYAQFQVELDLLRGILRRDNNETMEQVATQKHRLEREAELASLKKIVEEAEAALKRARDGGPKKRKPGDLRELQRKVKVAKANHRMQEMYCNNIDRFFEDTEQFREEEATLRHQTGVRNWALNELFGMVDLAEQDWIDLDVVVRQHPGPRKNLRDTIDFEWDYGGVEEDEDDRTVPWGRKKKNNKKRKIDTSTGADADADQLPDEGPRRKSRRLAGEEPEINNLLPPGYSRSTTTTNRANRDKPPRADTNLDRLMRTAREEQHEILLRNRERMEREEAERILREREEKLLRKESRRRRRDLARSGRIPETPRGERRRVRSPSLDKTNGDDLNDEDLNDLREAVNRQARELARARRAASPSTRASITGRGFDHSPDDDDLNALRARVNAGEVDEEGVPRPRRVGGRPRRSVTFQEPVISSIADQPVVAAKRRGRPSKKVRLANPRG